MSTSTPTITNAVIDSVAEFYAAQAATTYIPHDVTQFMHDWVEAVITASDPLIEDVRCDTTPIEVSHRDQNHNDAWSVEALRTLIRHNHYYGSEFTAQGKKKLGL